MQKSIVTSILHLERGTVLDNASFEPHLNGLPHQAVSANRTLLFCGAEVKERVLPASRGRTLQSATSYHQVVGNLEAVFASCG